MKIKEIILDTVDDLVAHFLLYDRKDDEELPRDVIEDSIVNGDITVDEIVDRFRDTLNENI